MRETTGSGRVQGVGDEHAGRGSTQSPHADRGLDELTYRSTMTFTVTQCGRICFKGGK